MYFKHGQKGTRLYDVWRDMIKRCENPNRKDYPRYGGRGIRVCPEWRKDFTVFQRWALEHGYKNDLTIERIDNDGNYEPGNCRWATAKEQARNRIDNRKIKIYGKIKLFCEWAEQAGIAKTTLWDRLDAGWPEHRLLEPVKGVRK